MPKYYLIICLILWTSCKEREEPKEQTGTPVFRITGTVGTNTIDLAAGVDNYYMSTDHAPDRYHVQVFTGELKKESCTGCGPSLKLSLRNYTDRPAYTIDSSDLAKDYIYYYQPSPIDSLYTVAFTSTSSGSGTPDNTWDFGNGTSSSLGNPTASYHSSGVYTITGTSSYPNGCSSSLAQPVFLTPTRVGKNIDFNVNYPDTLNLLFNCIPVDNGAAISWDFGDGQSGTGAIISHTYAASGLYRVCITYIKGADTMQYCKNVNTLDVTACKANYRFNSSLTIDSLNLSKVIVEWKNEAGIIYSSANTRQGPQSSFRIIDAKNYTVNEKGQRTRQLTVQFNCTVSNGTATIELSNMHATIAVAYP